MDIMVFVPSVSFTSRPFRLGDEARLKSEDVLTGPIRRYSCPNPRDYVLFWKHCTKRGGSTLGPLTLARLTRRSSTARL